MSSFPPRLTVEGWAADRAREQIAVEDGRPFFGFVSFIGPHPPLAPPVPFNRMYDPDRLPNPVRGDITVDHMDEQIPWMNYAIWADDINDSHARVVKARYYGELSYIDHCLGRILDAVDARADADNTLIVFYSDHGEGLGDHHSWQKESYFDAAANVPFLVSWPAQVPSDVRREELVCLTDLFGIATTAAGAGDTRDGVDVLGVVEGNASSREYLFGYYAQPGGPQFKVMAREKDWKYIYCANGAREQLFNVTEDPQELRQRIAEAPDVAKRLRAAAVEACSRPNVDRALEGGGLRGFPYQDRPRRRIYQFDRSRGVSGFPEQPGDVLDGFEWDG
jgi:arylsulfatase A-like enzyme